MRNLRGLFGTRTAGGLAALIPFILAIIKLLSESGLLGANPTSSSGATGEDSGVGSPGLSTSLTDQIPEVIKEHFPRATVRERQNLERLASEVLSMV